MASFYINVVMDSMLGLYTDSRYKTRYISLTQYLWHMPICLLEAKKTMITIIWLYNALNKQYDNILFYHDFFYFIFL